MAIVNVKNFGAIGDGVTDDTQAFLDALDVLLNTFETGYLYCPSGQYKLTQQLVIDKPFVGIKGDGISASSLNFSGDGIELSSYVDFSLASVEDISINGSNTGVGISMPNSNFYFLNKFYVGGFDIGIDATTAVLSKFTDFTIIGCRIGAQFTNGSYAVSIINGNVRGCTEAGIIESGSGLYIFATDIEAIYNGAAITTGAGTTIRDCHIESSKVGININSHGQVRVDNCYIGGCDIGIGQPASTFFNGFYSFKNLKFAGCTQELDISNIAYYQIEDTTCFTGTGGLKSLTVVPPQVYGVTKGLAYDSGNTGYFVSYSAAGILVNGNRVVTKQEFLQTINFGIINANTTVQLDFYEASGPFDEYTQKLLWHIESYDLPAGIIIMPFVKKSSTQHVILNVTNTTSSAINIGSQDVALTVVF